jgi:hypothetical protein
MFVFVPENELTQPRSGECLANCYWIIHPVKGLLFYKIGTTRAPQCNPNEQISLRILQNYLRHAELQGCEVKFIPAVYFGYKIVDDF